MLTPTNKNTDQNATAASAAHLLTAFNGQMQQFGTNNNDSNNNDRHRQEALANLFRSLSSLAGTTSQQRQPTQLGGHLMDAFVGANSVQNFTSSNNALQQQAIQFGQITTSTNNDTNLANSIQSVVAAAVMQQQLVSAALNQPPTLSQPQAHQPSPSQPIPATSQPVGALPYFGEQQLRSDVFAHASQQNPPYSGLEHEMQYTPMMNADQQHQQQQRQQQQAHQQRINYCTICNKELCNKYFMKTHMLKMHGINLEMEQPGENEDSRESQESNSNQETKSSQTIDNPERRSPDEKKSPVTSSQSSSSSNSSQPTNLSNNSTRTNEKMSHNSSAKKSSSSSKPTTSVMNGYAGNSMGGVVCDICNKELCSKYFLKVHKQNTHGIMTDYQDASQFVYTFGSPNPFMAPISMSQLGVPANGPPVYSVGSIYDSKGQFKNSATTGDTANGKKLKRARVAKDASNLRARSARSSAAETMSADKSAQQLDTVYRLMIAQQQQKHDHHHHHHQQQQQHQQTIAQPPFMPFDPIVANPMSALMCFGAMGPFGPAGISPTMIVEMILRNQHLFNRNNPQNAPQSSQNATRPVKDSKQKASSSGKSSKDSKESSRYFTHYTEACPMCDRRFKSIKWLKTHMMNDHKQEIGTYMQMMMKQLYSGKPMASLAPSSPLDQRQPAQALQAQQSMCFSNNVSMCSQSAEQAQGQPLKHQNLSPLYNQTAPNGVADMPLVNPQCSLQHPAEQQLNLVQNYLQQQKQIMEQKLMLDYSNITTPQPRETKLTAQDLIIDARCKHEIVSPTQSNDCKGLERPQSSNDRSPSEHLDLSSKFIADNHPSDSNDDFATQAQALIRSNRLEASSFFLDDNNNNVDSNNVRQTEYIDDDRSTKSSYQDELDGGVTTNLDANQSGSDLSQVQQRIKTTSTN